jgi:hypothetical protein
VAFILSIYAFIDNETSDDEGYHDKEAEGHFLVSGSIAA